MNQKDLVKKYKTVDPKMYRRARMSYTNQVHRCSNPNAQRFEAYGGKGIAVCYSQPEFILWWFSQLKKRKKWDCPTVGRIDHAGDYSFDNIRLEEKSENSREMITRYKTITPRRPILIYKDGKLVHRAESGMAAARWMGVPSSKTISCVCRGRRKTIAGFTCKYEEDVCS